MRQVEKIRKAAGGSSGGGGGGGGGGGSGGGGGGGGSGSDWTAVLGRADFKNLYAGHFTPQVEYAGPQGGPVRVLRFEKLSRDWRSFGKWL